MQYTYRDVFFPLLKTVFDLQILMPFSASAGLFCLFVSPLPHQENVSV